MVQFYYHLKREKMSAIAGGTQTSMLKERLKGCMAREGRLTCWTWHMDELHPSTGQRATPYSVFALETKTGMVGVGIMQLESISKACAENWEDYNNLGEKKKSSHCALLVKINSHAAYSKLSRRQNTNNAGISIYSFMILCMFSELYMWPLSKNQVMSNLWDYGVVEYQQCKNW